MKDTESGTSLKQLRLGNRALILRLVALGYAKTRIEIAHITHLTKMTVTNIVSELLSAGWLEEIPCPQPGAPGRPPIILHIAKHAPKVCGMLIKRELLQLIVTDIGGREQCIRSIPYRMEDMDAARLVRELSDAFRQLRGDCPDPIAAIGIACVGPLNAGQGKILNPPDFNAIADLDIVRAIHDETGLPVQLIHDASAGALAETRFGAGRDAASFVYLHIMNGIGAGLVLNGSVFQGDSGQAGELGHTSIRMDGPRCACGNRGCLELYANLHQMQRVCRERAASFPQSPLTSCTQPQWMDFLREATHGDALALAVLEDFCRYLSQSLINLLNMLDVTTIIIGYPAPESCRMIEDLLEKRLEKSVVYTRYRKPVLLHAAFGGDAPLFGAAACAAEQVFAAQGI